MSSHDSTPINNRLAIRVKGVGNVEVPSPDYTSLNPSFHVNIIYVHSLRSWTSRNFIGSLFPNTGENPYCRTGKYRLYFNDIPSATMDGNVHSACLQDVGGMLAGVEESIGGTNNHCFCRKLRSRKLQQLVLKTCASTELQTSK